MLVGLIISDAWFVYRPNRIHVFIGFKQSVKNLSFLIHIWWNLGPFIKSLPRLVSTIMRGKRFFAVSFNTRALPFITALYNLFVINGRKSLPNPVVLYELLNPIALAYWAMCDGANMGSGFIFCTDNYTFKEIVDLMNVLRIRYGLQCSINTVYSVEYDNTYYRIYIWAESKSDFISIVRPYFISSMLYKLGL